MSYGLEPENERHSRHTLRSGLSADAALEDLRRRLVRYAVKLVWNRADAEEVVQEAFKIAASKQQRVTDASFGPWMFRTTGNLCMNLRRRHKSESLSDWIDPPHGQTPFEAACAVERIETLRSCIAALPNQQRIALTLRWIEQFDYADVADVMAISESAVRAHVHQARRQLAIAMRRTDDA